MSVIGRMKEFISAIRKSFLVIEAFDASSKKDFERAMMLLEKAGDEGARDHDARLLRAHLYSKMGMYREAIRQLVRFKRALDKSNMPENTKRYLWAYGSLDGWWCLSQLEEGDPVLNEKGPVLRAELEEIDLKKVPGHLKRSFPLPDHPDRQRHGVK